MNSIIKFCIVIVFISLLSGCGNKSPKITVNIPVTIDIYKKYPKKSFSIQDISDIKYVALETTDNVLLDEYVKTVYVSDERIITANPAKGDVFVFDGEGKIVSYFNHKGGGDKEYLFPGQIVYDENAKEIFVCDNNKRKFLVFTENGEYKRTLRHIANTEFTLYDFDDETLLAYDKYGTENGSDKEYRTKPYLFLSKQDGSIVAELDRVLPVRYSEKLLFTVKDASGRELPAVKMTGFINNWHDGKDFIIADLSSDTIFQLTQDKKLSPLVIRTPSIHDKNQKIFLTPVIKNDFFIFLTQTTIDFESDDEEYDKSLVYSFADNEIYEASLHYSDLPGEIIFKDFEGVDTGKNMAVTMIDAYKILDYKKQGKLTGALKSLAEKLTEDNNPIVVIMKFK
ncbi:MAG: 6-bladed beta-propeller [Prevotellaceae bacterium]|jgi:hypothetical protein|nr:6-bladed beta-propeller [Prevotellaceae bacterium]